MTDSDHTPSPTHCISCGTEVPDHAEFCHGCGSAVYRPSEPVDLGSPAPKTGINFTAEAVAPQFSTEEVSQAKGSPFDFAAAKPFLLLISAAAVITIMYFLISPYQSCLRSFPNAFPGYAREVCAERHSW